MKLIKPIAKNIKRYKNSNFFKAKFRFSKYYEKTKLKEKYVLIQSYDGSSISGSPYYILLELCNNPATSDWKKFVVAQKKNASIIKAIINEKQLKNVEVVIVHSKKYCKLLSESKYLVNNSTFSPYFIKREGQVYLNTWHGTPLKCMGRDVIDSPHEIGNTQRNFLMADYLLYPNEFTFEKMKKAYMLDNLYKGKYLLSGYPRNTAFFNNERAKEVREELGIDDKKVIVYMPTWRGQIRNKKNEEQYVNIMHMLFKLEKELDENTIVYLKIHNLASSKINYSLFKKIEPFPDGYETYEFLNAANCLITDYSSVMFDFANTGRKVVLYIYDYEEYTENRGFYIDVKELPFSKAYTTKELVSELKDVNSYENYDEFREEFCKYDSIAETKKICELVFLNKKNKDIKIIDGKQFANNKKNVLIFSGALLKNGITSALKGLLNNINLDEKNYYLTFYRKTVAKNKYILNEFSPKLNLLPIQGQKSITIPEAIAQYLFFRLNINTKFVKRKLNTMYAREIKRIYPNVKFDYVIDFCGYDKQIIELFSYMDAKKIRFTHSTMQAEQKTRNNLHMKSIKHAYKTYDNIVGVREGMEEEINTLFKTIKPKKVSIVHNTNDISTIINNSKKEIEFQNNTYSNMTIEEINKILDNQNVTKFINIARFSKEKGLDRLVLAYAQYRKNNPDSYLFLIGGHGTEFNKIMNLIKDEQIENIVIIKNIINPFPILKKTDLFILSSYYEGLPMTIMEALILGIPVLSTNIKGPRKFLEKGYAHLVENSQDGLLKGMNDFSNNKFSNLKKFDAEEFNKKALQEFYNLFE